MVQLVGKKVGDLGYGLMGLTWRSEPISDTRAFEAMDAALAGGSNFFNAGEFYGPPTRNSLTLLREYYEREPARAEQVVLSVKGGISAAFVPDGSAAGVRASVENCLAMLGPRGRIDMFECARRDPKTPLAVTLGALAELVAEGKIGGVALSEVNANTIREAAAITKIVAVEVELSLFETSVLTNGVAAACKELDIPLVAYSPLGRGFLTGDIKSYADIPEGDFRQTLPRFQPAVFDTNIQLVRGLEQIARDKKCTPAQLALSWVLGLNARPDTPRIIPIPGAASAARVTENARLVQLTPAELATIDALLARIPMQGARYGEHAMAFVEG